MPTAQTPVRGRTPTAAAPTVEPRPGHVQRRSAHALRVQALKDLFFQNRRIRAGEVFMLEDPRKFKSGQMVVVTEEQPARAPKEFAAAPFPFPEEAKVKRGVPGLPRTAQGTRPTLNPRAGISAADDVDPPPAADREPLE